MANINITRYPNGLVNAGEGAPFGDHRQPQPATYYEYFNDFLLYTATDWLVTETDSGATETILAAGEGGQLVLTNTAGIADAVSLQLSNDGGTTATTPFLWEAGKDMVISMRMKTDIVAATTVGYLVGLAIADTSPVASLPGSGFFFTKPTTGAGLIASARKAGTSTSISLGTVVADTFFTATFYYTANDGTFRGFYNGAFVGSFSTASVGPIVALSPTISFLNAVATANVMTVDYLYCAKQR